MKSTVVAVALLCSIPGLAYAQGKKKEMLPGQGIDWKGTWEEAVKEATARNVPLHVAVHKDN